MNKAKHPVQPLVRDKQDIIRFKENRLVSKLLDAYPGQLNRLCVIAHEEKLMEDYVQLMQLIGYSVSGANDLSCMPRKLLDEVNALRDKMINE